VRHGGATQHATTATRRQLTRALALELGAGDVFPLLPARACLPLRRVVALEVPAPAAGKRMALRLVELTGIGRSIRVRVRPI